MLSLQFAPGEAFQVDWSEAWVKIDGVRTKLQIALLQAELHAAPPCMRALP